MRENVRRAYRAARFLHSNKAGHYIIYCISKNSARRHAVHCMFGLSLCPIDADAPVCPIVAIFGEGGITMQKWHVIGVLTVQVLIHCLLAADGFAQWRENGVPVCTAKGTQAYPYIISAGPEAVIISWWDIRNGNEDIYAQKVHMSGDVLWAHNGNPVCFEKHNQLYPQIAPDGAGGAIISWRDWRLGTTNSNPFAQRINSNGTIEWSTDGVALCVAGNHQKSPHIIPDGSGGAFVTWYDYREGIPDIYLQRIDSKGNLYWSQSGVCVCSGWGTQELPRIASDGKDGAIIVWQDRRFGNWDIYAQRVSGGGALMWPSEGVPVCYKAWDQYLHQLIPDGSGGAVVAWQDYRNGSADIYAQRINQYGQPVWQADGIAVCADPGEQTFPQVAADSVGGYVVAWVDSRNGAFDIYAQRIDADGGIAWNSNGIGVCSELGNQVSPQIISDGSKGVIIAWVDSRDGWKDIYAQRMDGNGDPLWTPAGVCVCGADNDQDAPQLIGDGSNGAYITWHDSRSGEFDIYVQKLRADGLFDMPRPSIVRIEDVPRDQGGKVTVAWNGSAADMRGRRMITHYSIWRSLSEYNAADIHAGDQLEIPGTSLPTEASRSMRKAAAVGGVNYIWEWLGDVDAHYFERYAFTAPTLFDSTTGNPGWHYFIVSAETEDPFVFYDSAADSGYSMDNLSPCAPRGLAGERDNFTGALRLTWSRNAEPDLAGYALHRGLSGDFVPAAANLIASVRDTTYLDGVWQQDEGYYYKMAAVDIHGNKSPFASLGPEQIAGDRSFDGPEAAYLAQNYPNPFNPATRIEFGLKSPAYVSLRIYSASGRLVRVLVAEDRAAGKYIELWDGRDSFGKSAASGVYFYRLDAGEFVENRKMVLSR